MSFFTKFKIQMKILVTDFVSTAIVDEGINDHVQS